MAEKFPWEIEKANQIRQNKAPDVLGSKNEQPVAQIATESSQAISTNTQSETSGGKITLKFFILIAGGVLTLAVLGFKKWKNE